MVSNVVYEADAPKLAFARNTLTEKSGAGYLLATASLCAATT